MKRVILSDVHLSDGPHDYDWLKPAQLESLAEFLQSPEVTNADQVILAGDLMDLWVHPIDSRPPTGFDVLDAGQNVDVVRALRELANARTKRRQVIYIPGNHDMDVTPAVAAALHPSIVFGRHFDDAGIRVRHGHEGCLFNAPDPTGRLYPVGYYLTRMTATGVARGHSQVNLDLWTILKNASEVERVADGKPLVQAVWDVVAEASGVAMTEWCIMPNGSPVQLGAVREVYSHVAEEWAQVHGWTSPSRAVESEWDPWYDLPITGEPRLHVVGHSHVARAARGLYGAYLNTGCWCGPEQTYAVVTTAMGIDHDEISGTLYTWSGGKSTPLSTTERIP